MISRAKSDTRLPDRFGRLAVLAVWVFIYLAMYGCGDGRSSKEDRTAQQRKTRTEIEARVATTPPSMTHVAAYEETSEPEGEPVSPTIGDVTFEDAYAAFEDERFGEAQQGFGAYAERNPEDVWGHYMVGLSAWKAGSVEDAVPAFERALALDPTHVKSLQNLGRVLLEQQQPERALERVEAALEIDPESAAGHRLLGRALAQLGKGDEAIESYHRAIALDREDAWSMNNLGLVLIRSEEFDEALPPLARATQLRDDVAVFHNNLGIALERTGHFVAAAEAFRKALAVNEAYEKAAANLARVDGVQDDPLADPIDLGVLAQRFEAEVDRRQQEIVSNPSKTDSASAGELELQTTPPDTVRGDSIVTRGDSGKAGKAGGK